MLEGALILVLTVVLVLVVAGGVVALLALSRRSADEWKGVIKRESEEIAEEVKTHHSLPKRASSSPDGPVVPRTASLHSLLQSADSTSAFDRGRRSADGGGESVPESTQL